MPGCRYSNQKKIREPLLAMMPSWPLLTRAKDNESLFEKSVWRNGLVTAGGMKVLCIAIVFKKRRSKTEGESNRESRKVTERERKKRLSLSLF
jgi:hypothetical protein